MGNCQQNLYDEWSDKAFVLSRVKKWGWSLQYASDDLKNCEEVVMAAVKSDGWALKYASKDLRNCKEIVLEAVKHDANILKYASNELKNCEEILSAAAKQNGNSPRVEQTEQRKPDLASRNRKNSKKVRENGKSRGIKLSLAPCNCKSHKEGLVEEAKQEKILIDSTSENINDHKEFVTKGLEHDETLPLVNMNEKDLNVVSEGHKNSEKKICFKLSSANQRKDNEIMEQNENTVTVKQNEESPDFPSENHNAWKGNFKNGVKQNGQSNGETLSEGRDKEKDSVLKKNSLLRKLSCRLRKVEKDLIGARDRVNGIGNEL